MKVQILVALSCCALALSACVSAEGQAKRDKQNKAAFAKIDACVAKAGVEGTYQTQIKFDTASPRHEILLAENVSPEQKAIFDECLNG